MTDDELKALVSSLAVSNKELRDSQKETNEQMKLTDEQMKRTDEQIKRTDEQMKRTSATLKSLGISTAAAQKATSEKMDRTDAQMKRTDTKLESIGIQLGNIGKNQGDVAEEFFYNSLIKHLHLGNIQFEDITKNMEKHRGKTQEEYDLFLTNGKAIAVIEVKYKAHINDLDKLDRKIANFKKLFPIYKDYDLYGGLASFNINDDAKQETLDRGYFVLQRSGDVICTEESGHLKHW